MEYEITIKNADGQKILTLCSDERRHSRAMRELANIPENKIAVDVMRTSRRPVRFAGIDEPVKKKEFINIEVINSNTGEVEDHQHRKGSGEDEQFIKLSLLFHHQHKKIRYADKHKPLNTRPARHQKTKIG